MARNETAGGWFSFANKLSEALAKTACTGSEHRVIHAILRETDGRQRAASRLSASRIGEITGLRRRRVSDILRQLEAREIVTITRAKPKVAGVICLQKDFSRWKSESPLARQTDPADDLTDPADEPSNSEQTDPADCASDPADGPETDPADAAQQTQYTEPNTHRVGKPKRKPTLKPAELEEYAETLYLKTGVSGLDGFRPLSAQVLKTCMTRRPGTRSETIVRWYAWKIPDLLDRPTKPENLGKAASNWFGMACQGLSKLGIDDQLKAAMEWAAGFDRAEEAAKVAEECRAIEAEKLVAASRSPPPPAGQAPFRLTRIPLKVKSS